MFERPKKAKKGGRARGWRRACVWLALISALALMAPAPTLALDDPQRSGWTRANRVGRGAFDLVVLRPLQLVQVAVSAAFFVPAYPVSLPFGAGEDVLELCITEPAERARTELVFLCKEGQPGRYNSDADIHDRARRVPPPPPPAPAPAPTPGPSVPNPPPYSPGPLLWLWRVIFGIVGLLAGWLLRGVSQ